MAYVEPNSTVKLLSNVPLLPNYQDTIYFTTEAEQYAYFDKLSKYNCQKQSYQRVNRGVFKFGIPTVNKFYNINYMMFKNTNFENKWFYAFVTKVEYINNNCVEVSFEIDVMQTYFFDYELKSCLIDREHTATDKIGEHVATEDFKVGDYVNNQASAEDVTKMGLQKVCILTALDNDLDPQQGQTWLSANVYNNIWCNLNVIADIYSNDYASLQSKIFNIINFGNQNSIYAVYQYPGFITLKGNSDTATEHSPTRFSYKLQNPNLTSIDGYTPKNKKLFCYPYNFIRMDNGYDKTYDYYYEDFAESCITGKNFLFTFYGAFVPTAEVMAVPNLYKNRATNYSEALFCNAYPTCGFSGEEFANWYGQNKVSNTIRMVGSAITGGLTGAVFGGNAGAGAVLGLSNSIVSTAVDTQQAVDKPDTYKLNLSGSAIITGLQNDRYKIYYLSIKKEIAEIIDSYFTMYGYKCGKVKVPNRSVRPFWTYTKTVNCKIIPNFPSDDAQKICDIYNNGVTFWQPNATVGDYISQDNSVN